MVIDAGGDVGIGTTVPFNPLDVIGQGTDIGGVNANSEVIARFLNTIVPNHTAIAVDSLLDQDSIIYLAENTDAAWDLRNDASTNSFNIRYQVGLVNTTRFVINSVGDAGLNRTSVSHPFHVGTNSTNGNGAHVTDGGMWTNGSDRNTKESFEEIDKQDVLYRVLDMPVTRWKYIGESEDVRHIGPVAQDFHAAFGLGESNTHIGTIDAEGVALAAIQGLHEVVAQKECEIQALRDEVIELKTMVNALLANKDGER
jgi:hypothetical protein